MAYGRRNTTEVAAAVIIGLLIVSMLIASIVQAVQGDWLPAIYFAILYTGFNLAAKTD